jgi:hypothetical protein
MEKEAEQMALVGTLKTESIEPYRVPTKQFQEDCKELFADIKKGDIKIYIDGKEVKGSE